MIAVWMVYAVVVSVLVSMAAGGFEAVCRSTRLPSRFAWVAAVLVTVVLLGLAPFRSSVQPSVLPASLTELPVVALNDAGGPEASGHGHWLAASVQAIRNGVQWPLQAVARFAPAAAAPGGAPGAESGDTVLGEAGAWPVSETGLLLGIAWLLASVGLIVLGAATLHRYGAERRRWPVREVAGTPVRVSPAAGPGVVGLLRPEIVVPKWLLATSSEEQRVVVLHEREHLIARDPWVLAAGWLGVAVAPWNPVAWLMLRRLRLAVEMDCDARVLAAGVRPRAYGEVLIDMAGRGSGLPLGAPALAGTRSTLEKRIVAMSTPVTRSGRARAFGLGTLGAVALLAACETRMPTSVEIDEMDVDAAAAHAEMWRIIAPDQERVLYYLDGMEVTPEEARAIAAEDILELRVVRASDGEAARIRLRTRDGDTSLEAGTMALTTEARATGERRRLVREQEEAVDGGTMDVVSDERRRILGVRAGERAEGTERVLVRQQSDRIAFSPMSGFEGLVVIDGVVADVADLRRLHPDQIADVEILKGPAAVRAYDDPRAEHGVIRITRK
jgi:hypothetical protein